MIESAVQKLTPGTLVDLFELDMSFAGAGTLYFHSGQNELQTSIVWQGNTYQPFPIAVKGFEITGNGKVPRPTVQVANVTGMISSYLSTLDDLVGCKFIRHRTLAQYLDAANFPPRRNLLTYSDDLSTNWEGTATKVFGQTDPNDGNSAVLLPDLSGTSTAASTVYSALTTVPSHQLTASLYFKPNTSGTLYLRVLAYDESNVYLSDRSQAFTVEAGSPFVRHTAPVTLPVNTAKARMLVGASAGLSGVAYGAQLEANPVATEYQAVGATFSANPSADPTQEFPLEVWFIDRKSTENKWMVEFELAAAWDVQGVLLPRRQCIANLCVWRYKGDGCKWVPVVGKYYDEFDQPATSVTDKCSKRLEGCKLRFGANAELPYGGFPSVGLIA